MTKLCEFDFNTFEYNIDSNLEAMGLPVPSDVVGAATTTFGALKAIDEALVAGVTSPYTKIAGAGAAFWAGAVIGSAAMAANRATTCNKSMLRDAVNDLGLDGSWIDEAWNELYDKL
ncbi:hypothetical protein WAX87_11035 [Photobacterium damselae subsp. damselae]|uniref:hypothetical protein n=1 Tax=Photobacterium damselae TaxID=38293 RepID=UPI00311B2169